MKTSLTIISIFILLFGCSSSNKNSEISNGNFEGTWVSECVDMNLLPFPMYSTIWEGFIIMELNFGNGNFYSFSHMYSDNQCQNVELEYVSYEGTYVVVDNDNLQLSNGVTQLDMELNDLLMFIDLGSFTTYYLIEDGFLFMNDTSSSDVSINRNVAFTKEN